MVDQQSDTQDFLLLKFNNLKDWRVSTERARQAVQEYFDIGVGSGVMVTHLSDRQKELLCTVIDECQGHIRNDWTGRLMTKDEAKAYVMAGASR